MQSFLKFALFTGLLYALYMENKQSSFLIRAYNPIFQALSALCLAIGLMVVAQGLKWSGMMSVSSRAFWIIAGTSILSYAIMNSIISLSSSDMNRYWFRSTASYAVLMLSCGFLAYLFSARTITEAGTFRWIFMVLTFGYLLFLSITRFARKIDSIAQKEDEKWENRTK